MKLILESEDVFDRPHHRVIHGTWRNYLFTDETEYHFDSNVWTRVTVVTDLNQNMTPSLAFGDGSETVWSGTSLDSSKISRLGYSTNSYSICSTWGGINLV